MIGVDVGDHGQDRLQQEERGIALVGLRHQVLARAQARVRAGTEQAPADDEGGVESAGGEQAGHEARGGGLAVGAGHRDAVAKAHQLGEHLRARHHRARCRRRRLDHFRVVRPDRSRPPPPRRPATCARSWPMSTSYPEAREPLGHRARGPVGAGDLEAQGVQHLRDAAHAGAADADEVHAAHPAHARLGERIETRAADGSAGSATGHLQAVLRHALGRIAHRSVVMRPRATSAISTRRRRVLCSVGRGSRPARPASRRSSARRSAAPRSASQRALRVWWSSVAYGNGTSMDATPTAASSATVIAPARHTATSAHE